LSFIEDVDLRESIRADIGAVNRALANSEWRAANVFAGAAIEALLHWKLNQSQPSNADVDAAVVAGFTRKPSRYDRDYWTLEHFSGVARHAQFLEPETFEEVKLAQNYRNLIHAGRAARLSQRCDRGTALCAVGALEHVVRDLS
jgi:hypothetical protein